MASSLPNLTDNLAEGIHKIKCQYEHDNIKCETCGIKYKDCECYLAYENLRDDKDFDKDLQKQFANKYKFSNHKLILLSKGIYPYKYMDDCKKFKKISLPEKDFYSNLNMEHITDADYRHPKRVLKDFKIKKLW